MSLMIQARLHDDNYDYDDADDDPDYDYDYDDDDGGDGIDDSDYWGSHRSVRGLGGMILVI